MHFLAHLYLSDSDPLLEIGQIAGDFVHINDSPFLATRIQTGYRLHLKIDAFTDQHSNVKACKRILSGPYRRYAGLSLDLLFDHLLAKHWSVFSDTSYETYISKIETRLLSHRSDWPDETRGFIGFLLESQLLRRLQYQPSLRDGMTRITRRLKRPINIEALVDQLILKMPDIETQFLVFFPELINYSHNQARRLIQFEQHNKPNQ